VDKVLQAIPVLFAAVMIAAATHTKPASISREGVILTAPAANDDAAMQVASDGEAPIADTTPATTATSDDALNPVAVVSLPTESAESRSEEYTPPAPVYPVARPRVVYSQCGPTGCYSGGYQYRTRRALLPWRR
jgi:hypothetical protein